MIKVKWIQYLRHSLRTAVEKMHNQILVRGLVGRQQVLHINAIQRIIHKLFENQTLKTKKYRVIS